MNESEIIPSNSGTIKESDEDIDVSEESMLKQNNTSSRKRKHDDSISECSNVAFLKEKTLKLKKGANLEKPTSSGFPIIKDSSPKALENDKVEKFTKEISPFESIARNFFQNNNISKVKEEIVSRLTSSLNLKKVKTEIVALPPESREDRSYKYSVYETFGRRGEKIRSRQRDFSRERAYSKSYSYYNNNRRHSLTSRNYDNS
uniref:Uncharacterized protein n=1 Tax=Strongyloides venezuelensis TaxID=75913 RepID=A0A0K0FXB4_STRVS